MLPCCSRTACEVTSRLPNLAASAWIAASIAARLFRAPVEANSATAISHPAPVDGRILSEGWLMPQRRIGRRTSDARNSDYVDVQGIRRGISHRAADRGMRLRKANKILKLFRRCVSGGDLHVRPQRRVPGRHGLVHTENSEVVAISFDCDLA